MWKLLVILFIIKLYARIAILKKTIKNNIYNKTYKCTKNRIAKFNWIFSNAHVYAKHKINSIWSNITKLKQSDVNSTLLKLLNFIIYAPWNSYPLFKNTVIESANDIFVIKTKFTQKCLEILRPFPNLPNTITPLNESQAN